VLAAHLAGEVAEVEAEQEEPLHGPDQVAQRRDQAAVAGQRGELDVEVLVALQKLGVGLPVVKGVLGGGELRQPAQLLGGGALGRPRKGVALEREPSSTLSWMSLTDTRSTK
jgi:hypothetical protein